MKGGKRAKADLAQSATDPGAEFGGVVGEDQSDPLLYISGRSDDSVLDPGYAPLALPSGSESGSESGAGSFATLKSTKTRPVTKPTKWKLRVRGTKSTKLSRTAAKVS